MGQLLRCTLPPKKNTKGAHPLKTTLTLLSALHNKQATVSEVLAAMIPCSRLYGYLGCTLAAATRSLGRHAYSEWMDTYSGAEYLVSVTVRVCCAWGVLTRLRVHVRVCVWGGGRGVRVAGRGGTDMSCTPAATSCPVHARTSPWPTSHGF